MSSATNPSNINPYGIRTTGSNGNKDENQQQGNTTTKTTSKRLESAAITGRKPLGTTTQQNMGKQLTGGTGLIASVPASQQQQLENLIKPKDTLEYIIKFPTQNYRNEQRPSTALDQTEGDDFVFVYNDTHVPIVMLLGWAGCQDRYLMKYSKIYEDRG